MPMATIPAIRPALRNRAVDVYAGAVLLGGLAALALALRDTTVSEPHALLLVLGLVVACERFPALLYTGGRTSISFVGVIFAALQFGVLGAVIVGFTIAASGVVFFNRTPQKVAFNLGMHLISAFVLAQIAHAAGLLGESGLVLMPAGAALGGLLFIMETTTVALAIALSSGTPFRQVFRHNFAWSAPHYIGLGIVVGGVALVYEAVGIVGLVVYLVPVAVGGIAMKQVMDKTRASVIEIERSHEALFAAHSEITGLLAAVPDVMLRISRDLVVTDIHRPEGTVLPNVAVVGKPVSAAVGGPAGEAMAALVSRAFETGEPQMGEIRLGTRRQATAVDVRAVRMDEGRCLVMLRDISERVQAEEAKLLAEELRRSVTRNAPIALFATDGEGRLTLLEGQALEPLGVDVRAALGQPAWEIFGHEASFANHLRMAQDGRTASFDLTVDDIVFSTHTGPLQDQEGHRTGMVGVALDDTSRRRVEAAMVESQKLESLGVLAGGIAHDFNNLLVGILGNAGLALSELPERSPVRETVASIEVAGRRAADLARQMLAYSGRGKLQVTTVDVNEMAAETSKLLRSSIPRMVRLDLDLADGIAAIEADATQIRQVVMNLVINASDAIGENEGLISVRSAMVEIGSERLQNIYPPETLTPGKYVSLKVTDTGSGMDEATRAKIFEPFFTTKFTGRGLGLAAVVGIARGHRGAIRVSSEPGVGSAFELLIPAAQRQAIVPLPQPVSARNWRTSGTVLVIDDDATVALVTRRALKMHGFTVLTANDGATGVEIVRQRTRELACVLLDMTMPGMSGSETLEAIHEVDPSIPVIIMSGFAREEVDSHFHHQRVAGFIQKPYQIDELIAHLRGIIESDAAA